MKTIFTRKFMCYKTYNRLIPIFDEIPIIRGIVSKIL